MGKDGRLSSVLFPGRRSPVGGNEDDRASPCLGEYRVPGCCLRWGGFALLHVRAEGQGPPEGHQERGEGVGNCLLPKDSTKKISYQNFPDSPVVKTPHFHCKMRRFDPCWVKKKNQQLPREQLLSPPIREDRLRSRKVEEGSAEEGRKWAHRCLC